MYDELTSPDVDHIYVTQWSTLLSEISGGGALQELFDT